MRPNIEEISEQDIEAYHSVLDSVGREHKFISFLEAPPLEQTRAFVLRNITHDYPQFVAKVNKRVVGWCDILPKEAEIYSHAAVLGMGVLGEFRNQGIGSMLIETALHKAFSQNIVRVELAVFSDNVGAIELYKKIGFCVEGELQDDVFIDGEFKSSLIMALVKR